MDVPEAWTKATGAGVTVGIVDTGLLTTHPDLANQVATNAGETGTDALGRDKRSNGVDDDGNGYLDDWHGWDFVSEYPSIGVTEGDSTAGPDNEPQDNHGHGTHVAGTVAAQRDNNEGIAGVAPGAKIMPLRGLGANGRGTSIAIAEAFDYAGKMGLRVVNASLGGPGLDQSQLAAIQAHPNTLYVIAAGNDNVNVDATPYGPCALPAANVMCVGASDENDRQGLVLQLRRQQRRRVRARHGDPVDLHRRPRTRTCRARRWPARTRRASRRSCCRPGPAASALDVKSAIMASTDAKPELSGKAVTGGRVNADRAVTGTLGGAPVNVVAARHHGHAAPGRRARRVDGLLEPDRDLVRLRLAAVVRRRRDLDGDRRRDRARSTPRAPRTSARSCASRSPPPTRTASRARPRRRSAPSPRAPRSTPAAPVISGTPRRGQILSVSATWNPAGTSYTYQWQRSTDGITWTAIGTNASTYTLTTAEREARVRVIVTATNAYGQATVTSDPVGPVALGPAGQHHAAGRQRHDAAQLHADRGRRRVGRDRQRLRATSGSATTAAAGRRSAARPPRPTSSPRRTRARASACS